MARQGSAKLSAKEVESEKRCKTVLQLRIKGMTFEAIGVELGISRQAAHQRYGLAMEALAAETRGKASDLRDLELARLDEIQAGLHEKATGGDHLAAAAEMKVMERRARLLGLDAPTRSELSGPGGNAIPIESAPTTPEALHARLAALAARAAG